MDAWLELDYVTKAALLDWYNIEVIDVDTIDEEDQAKLLDILENGNFVHFECAECGEEIVAAEPEDWADFQGVKQCEYLGRLCADCASVYLRLKEFADE